MQITELLFGHGQNLYSMVLAGESPVKQFIDSLEEIDLKQTMQLIKFISDHGPPANKRKFKHLGNEIYELKTYRGVRIFSFFGEPTLPRSLILTHGMFKPKQKILNREIKKVIEFRKDFFDRLILLN